MKFFDRVQELSCMTDVRQRSERVAQFTVVTGRRRVGKTALVIKSLEKETFAYLFVERKSEKDLCASFTDEINAKFGDVILGVPERFEQIFEALMRLARTRHINVVIDEFQEFRKVNNGIFSSIQKIWDRYKGEARINLIVSGSVNTLMVGLFRNRKAALYGRETAFMVVEPFTVETVKEILRFYVPKHKPEDILALWSFTGGVAKYIELLMDAKCFTRDAMLKEMIRANSVFLDEGRAVLVEEFDREYGVYFSILCAIARGLTTRNEIEQTVGRAVGGYLTRLENDYALIRRHQPLFAKPSAKTAHYELNDRFLIFWFRFVYRYSYILELKGYEMLRKIVLRDYEVFSGGALEEFFRRQYAESGEWTRIGSWWDRKGENEIDIIAENELAKKVSYLEVKRNPVRYSQKNLLEKVATFRRATGEHKDYHCSLVCLSLEDVLKKH